MKKEKGILLFLVLFFPIFINATVRNYTDSLNNAKTYITKGNYKNTYSKYFNCGSQTDICDKSGFIDKETYENSKIKGLTYLFDGVEYFTETESGNKVYIVTYTGQTELKDKSSKYSSRAVEIVKSDIKINGNGTYNNPWTFDPMYRVKINTDLKYSSISGSSTVYVSKGESVSFTISANSGYKYIENDCGGSYSNGILTISNIRKDTTCNVIFGTGKYEITLNGASPNKIYLNYNENYYSDSTYDTIITKINSVNEKDNYEFLGYKYTIDGTTYTIIDSDLKINRTTANKIKNNVELFPSYKIDSPNTPTISGGVTKVYYYQPTTLTCTNTSTYDSDVSIYYQFGYATSTSNFNAGTINWLGSASTTNTYSLTKGAFRGTRYYTCKIYVSDGSNSSDVINATTTTTMTLVNARINFDATTNGGTISGETKVYIPYGIKKMYKTRTGSSTATAPTASKEGYTFDGWYTASSGGDKVIDADGTILPSVTGWTNANSQWLILSTANTTTVNMLYAQFVEGS